MNKLKSESDKLAHAAVQYFREALVIDIRMKSESNVMRRMPTHCIARPIFESIAWDLVSGRTSLKRDACLSYAELVKGLWALIAGTKPNRKLLVQ